MEWGSYDEEVLLDSTLASSEAAGDLMPCFSGAKVVLGKKCPDSIDLEQGRLRNRMWVGRGHI